MIKRLIFTLVGLVVVFGAIFGWRLFVDSKIREHLATQEQPPVAVAAIAAETSTWQPSIEVVAALQADQGVDVTASVPGQITEIRFDSGQQVSAGDILVLLDSRTEAAERERLEAASELAELQLNRQEELVGKNLAPQSALDEARAEYRQIRAQVSSQQTLIDKMEIKAPFDGILGIRQVDMGQYLSPGMPIVTLQALQPLHADFTLPQQLFRTIDSGMPVTFTTDTYPESSFTGRIAAINPKIESNTRNFKLRATIANAEMLLRPGMYGQVEIELGESVDRITLPQTAISYNPYGDVVFVLKQEASGETDVYIAHRRFIVTGETRGDQVAIIKGIEPGEMVVVTGTHKLNQGAPAVINNDVMPSNDPSPNLKNQ